jgi:hypothetical protein
MDLVTAASRAPRSTLAEFLGDAVIFRSLDPLDRRLPRYAEMAPRLDLSPDDVPRKSDPMYARVVVEIVRAAARLGGRDIERLLFVGDTRGNDAVAFGRICVAGDWPGIGFIGSEDAGAPAAWEEALDGGRALLFATRWGLLDDLDGLCDSRGLPIDDRTAVLVDIDKTAIGARGRNDGAIDRARVDAVQRTIGDLLGGAPDEVAVRHAYDRLNRPSFHRLTADNQDVVALLALAVVARLVPEAILDEDEIAGDLSGLLADAADRAASVPQAARDTVRRFADGAADWAIPEFEAFRRNEYVATVERMGLDSEAVKLTEEITITAEVRDAALRWRDRGALLLGLSDKPDAASLPTAALAAKGYLPLHRTAARVVGD